MCKTIHPSSLFIAVLLSAIGASALADENAPPAPATQPDTRTAPAIDGYTHAPYPLTTCVVSGEKLDAMGEPYVIQVNGREVQLCCKGCKSKVRADPAAYLEKIDQAVTRQQLDTYPLSTCLIDKTDPFGDKTVNIIWQNRLIRFCCPPCIKDFKSAPATHLQDLNRAVIDKQKANYPLDTCVVSGEKLASMDQPVDHVVGHRLVRLCCKGCAKDLSADPARYLAILDAAQPGHDKTPDRPTQSQHEETDAGNQENHEGHEGH